MCSSDLEKLLVVNNFYGRETKFTLPDEVDVNGWTSEIILSNYDDSENVYENVTLRPYESVVYRMTK